MHAILRYSVMQAKAISRHLVVPGTCGANWLNAMAGFGYNPLRCHTLYKPFFMWKHLWFHEKISCKLPNWLACLRTTILATVRMIYVRVVPKRFFITHHLWVPCCQHVPPCSRKIQCAKYHSIKSLENQKWHKCNMKKMAVRKYYGHF